MGCLSIYLLWLSFFGTEDESAFLSHVQPHYLSDKSLICCDEKANMLKNK